MTQGEGAKNSPVTWHRLQDGCAYGVRLADRVGNNRERAGEIKGCVEDLEKKVDRLTWALAASALSFAGTAAGLLLNWLA